MQISIQGGSSTAEPDLASHINNRLYFAVGRFVARVQRVSVKLRDANAQKGGVDKQCRMILVFKGGGEVVVEKRSDDWLLAVNDAANCMGRAVARAISLDAKGRRIDRRRL